MCGVLCMSASHHKATEFRGHVKYKSKFKWQN